MTLPVTRLDSITHSDNTVKVTLIACRDRKFRSLDATATRHFMNWQKSNWPVLRYKSSEIVNSISEDILGDSIRYSYTLVIKLKF